MAKRLDPVLLEVLHSKVQAAAEQMGTTLQRTARTLFVKEAADFATALVGTDGKLFAHPRQSGVSLFVDCDCSTTINAVSDLQPGDIIITNDAYTSGGLSTHLPDLHLIQPYFFEGEIAAYGWAFVHSTDVGGIAPGSILPTCDSYFQEGLVIPPMKLARQGVLDEDLLAMIRTNCRIPDENIADIKAMVAALPPSRLRYWERTDLVSPGAQADGFDFEGLLELRRLVHLVEGGVPVRRNPQEPRRLARALPRTRPAPA